MPKSIGELCEVVGGGTPAKNNAAYFKGNILWATVRDMNAEVIEDTAFKITAEAVKSCATNIIPPNNVVIASRVGLGKVCLTRYPTAINQDLRGIIPRNSNALSVRYLYWWFRSIAPLIEKEGKGATVKGITLPFIKSLRIPVPPLKEQERSVATLGEAFASLDSVDKNTTKCAASSSALFASFLHESLERFNRESSVVTVAELVRRGVLERPQDGNHGEKHPTRAEYVSAGVPFVMAADLQAGGVNTVTCRFISKTRASNLRIGFAMNGDVLLSHKGTIGRVAVLETDLDYVMLTPQVTYYRVLDRTRLLNRYLYYYFQSEPFQKALAQIAGAGSTRAYIGITRQLDLEVLVPPLLKQSELVERLTKLEPVCAALSDNYHEKREQTKLLRKALLAATFDGNARATT